jgi:hypothetical protein
MKSSTDNMELFSEISSEESSQINGGHYSHGRRHWHYRRWQHRHWNCRHHYWYPY